MLTVYLYNVATLCVCVCVCVCVIWLIFTARQHSLLVATQSAVLAVIDSVGLSVRLSWYHVKTTQAIRSCGLHWRIAHDSRLTSPRNSKREHRGSEGAE